VSKGLIVKADRDEARFFTVCIWGWLLGKSEEGEKEGVESD